MSVSQQSLVSSLESMLPDRVRTAEEKDIIAGVAPHVVVEPQHENEVAALLAYANKEGLKVLVRGGGTQLGLGFPPTGGDVLLSMARMNSIVEHAPHDLTATVQAGLPLVRFQQTLAEARQWLAFDPDLSAEATMGGIIATNVSGPRRLRYGGVRDQIIGVRVVLADGTIAKGGGKVVKNVAGYDLPKLFTGSLGTLGVIVEATFRLYPLPAASHTVTFSSAHFEPLCQLAVQVIGSTLSPTIVDIFGTEPDVYTLAVRFETGKEAAEEQCIAFTDMAQSVETRQEIQTLQGEHEEQFWSRMGKQTIRNDATCLVLKVSILPTDVAYWLTHLQKITKETGLTTTWRSHAGHGLTFVRLSGEASALVKATHELRQAALMKQGSVVVLDAPLSLLQQLDVWGPSSAIEVMRRIKIRFDPNGTLNPGRFIGRI